MSSEHYFTVNFADENGAATDRKMSFRQFETKELAQQFIDERRLALDELQWKVAIVEHQAPEQNEEDR